MVRLCFEGQAKWRVYLGLLLLSYLGSHFVAIEGNLPKDQTCFVISSVMCIFWMRKLEAQR